MKQVERGLLNPHFSPSVLKIGSNAFARTQNCTWIEGVGAHHMLL